MVARHVGYISVATDWYTGAVAAAVIMTAAGGIRRLIGRSSWSHSGQLQLD